ncbi:hypothetical protein [Yoonia vestfoldensis]|jgi:hypothetical protein|uniref:hypothetical protein n=1 Tax=Yoonia vestfoldensis TaxID=245188 RepID=UPI0012FFB8CB|nr:hypothetical protein [Yoonia vestfoldensis]
MKQPVTPRLSKLQEGGISLFAPIDALNSFQKASGRRQGEGVSWPSFCRKPPGRDHA